MYYLIALELIVSMFKTENLKNNINWKNAYSRLWGDFAS